MKKKQHFISLCCVFAMGISGLAGVTACSTPPQLIASPVGDAPVAAMDQARMEAMIKAVDHELKQADGAKDINKAGGRITGPAAVQRNGDYRLSTAIENAQIEPLPLNNNQAMTVTNASSWPRFGLSVSPVRENKPVYVFSYIQGNARQNYALWGFVKLFPKVKLPQTFKTDLGAPQYGPQSKDLKMDPGAIAKQYADLLLNPNDEKIKGNLDIENDANLQSFIKKKQDYEQALQGVPGVSVEFLAQPSGHGFVSLGTAQGGALVMATIDYSLTIKSGRALNLPKATAVFLGGKSTAKSMIKENHLLVALFWIPSKNDKEKTKVLGAADSIVGVEAD